MVVLSPSLRKLDRSACPPSMRPSPDFYLNTTKINIKKVWIWGLTPPPWTNSILSFLFYFENLPKGGSTNLLGVWNPELTKPNEISFQLNYFGLLLKMALTN